MAHHWLRLKEGAATLGAGLESACRVLQTLGMALGMYQVGDLEALAAEADQYAWGSAEADGVPALAGRLREARAWVSSLNAVVKAKPELATLEPLLAWDPPPVHHAGAIC